MSICLRGIEGHQTLANDPVPKEVSFAYNNAVVVAVFDAGVKLYGTQRMRNGSIDRLDDTNLLGRNRLISARGQITTSKIHRDLLFIGHGGVDGKPPCIDVYRLSPQRQEPQQQHVKGLRLSELIQTLQLPSGERTAAGNTPGQSRAVSWIGATETGLLAARCDGTGNTWFFQYNHSKQKYDACTTPASAVPENAQFLTFLEVESQTFKETYLAWAESPLDGGYNHDPRPSTVSVSEVTSSTTHGATTISCSQPSVLLQRPGAIWAMHIDSSSLIVVASETALNAGAMYVSTHPRNKATGPLTYQAAPGRKASLQWDSGGGQDGQWYNITASMPRASSPLLLERQIVNGARPDAAATYDSRLFDISSVLPREELPDPGDLERDVGRALSYMKQILPYVHGAHITKYNGSLHVRLLTLPLLPELVSAERAWKRLRHSAGRSRLRGGVFSVSVADLSHMLDMALKIFGPSGTPTSEPRAGFCWTSQAIEDQIVAITLWKAVCEALGPHLASFLRDPRSSESSREIMVAISDAAPLRERKWQHADDPRLSWCMRFKLLLIIVIGIMVGLKLTKKLEGEPPDAIIGVSVCLLIVLYGCRFLTYDNAHKYRRVPRHRHEMIGLNQPPRNNPPPVQGPTGADAA
ncbi:MAG: hypothetical protein AAF355_11495 [Myxococcota bacterium]